MEKSSALEYLAGPRVDCGRLCIGQIEPIYAREIHWKPDSPFVLNIIPRE
jgi:hypothetical protein